MAISRPFLLALVGVALLGATVFAVQNARNGAADKPAPTAQQAAEQATPASESTAPKEMPKADVQVSVNVPGFDGSGGFVTTGDRAWFTRGRVGYAVPQAAWAKIVKAREKGTPPTAKAVNFDVDPSAWLRNVKSEGTERMDGVEVTHVSADV